MTPTVFNIRNLSDAELNAVMAAINEERAKRESKKEAQRESWIDLHFHQFHNTYDAIYHTRENLTIVAIYDRLDGVNIGTAYPVNGDAYDCKTGIAVAFAKANGETIPDYI